MNHIAITFTATRAFEKHHYMFIGDDTLTSKFYICTYGSFRQYASA